MKRIFVFGATALISLSQKLIYAPSEKKTESAVPRWHAHVSNSQSANIDILAPPLHRQNGANGSPKTKELPMHCFSVSPKAITLTTRLKVRHHTHHGRH